MNDTSAPRRIWLLTAQVIAIAAGVLMAWRAFGPVPAAALTASTPLPTPLSRSSIALLVVWVLVTGSGCAALRPDVPPVASHAIADGQRTTLGRVLAAQAAQHPGLSGFQVMATGHSAFVTRAALADAAERTLDLQYYSVGEDLTTDLLLLRIVAAAGRGVRVRILLDDIHVPARLFARRAIAEHPGIQVRLFNPFTFGGTSGLARLGEFIVDGERLNRRMHNKLWVTDNAAAIVGSRNLADAYFGADDGVNFYDVDLLAAGPIVGEMSRAFDAYWNSAAAVPVEALAHPPDASEANVLRRGLRARTAGCDHVPACRWLNEGGVLDALRSGSVALSWASAQLTYDPPDRDKRGLTSGFEHGWIDDDPGGVRTHAELLIVSPYFVPSEDELRHLGEMRERGVRVAVLTNSLAATDSPVAHAGYARHRAGLLRRGVELYELRPASGVRHRLSHRWTQASPFSLHAKLIVQDRARAIVGSQNQDPRSRLHNTEAWIAIKSPELAADLAALFEEGTDPEHAYKLGRNSVGGIEALVWRTDEDGKTVHYDVEPMSSLWLRLWRGVLGALIPEHLL